MTTATSILTKPIASGPHPLTQLGNAERYLDKYGEDVLYCPKTKQWYVWDGSRWMQDEMLTVRKNMTATVRDILSEAAKVEDDNTRQAMIKWERASESDSNIRGAMANLQHKVAVGYDDFDQNLWLLNFPNGTLDLKTDQFRENDRGDRITKTVPYEYDTSFLFGECPRWEQFLREIFPPPYDSIIPFLQRVVGYSLTGSIDEQCLFLLHGTGANGKSVFVKVIQHVLGKYAMQAGWQSFSMKKGAGMEIREDIARLAGSRFVAAIESDQHTRLAEHIIKAITGGDRITARHLYQNSFEFVPQFKLWLVTNYLPKIIGQDEAIWRRIMLVPFTVKFPKSEQDTGLADTLIAEAPGILNWARQGLKYYLASGLQPPTEVLRATAEYRSDSDQLNHFLNERAMSVAPNGSTNVMVSSLYQVYDHWATATGETYIMSERDFNKSMESRGVERKRGKRGNYWSGLALSTHSSTEQIADAENEDESENEQEELFNA